MNHKIIALISIVLLPFAMVECTNAQSSVSAIQTVNSVLHEQDYSINLLNNFEGKPMIQFFIVAILSFFPVPQDDYQTQKEFSDRLNYVNGLVGMLRNPEVVDQLEIVDFQKSELKKIGQEVQARLVDLSIKSTMKGGRGEDIIDEYKTLKTFLEGKVKKIKEEVLVPGQFEKLERAYFRQVVFYGHHFNLSGLTKLIPDLGVSKEQEDEMQKIAKDAKDEIKKLTEEFDKKVKAVQLKSKKKILGKLNPEQQKMVKEKFGTIIPEEAKAEKQ